MDDNERLKPDDLEEEAAVLPAREAMSLITPDAFAEIEEAPDGTAAAQGVASEAQGSASGEESSSSQNQST